jgi:hypothetical protein
MPCPASSEHVIPDAARRVSWRGHGMPCPYHRGDAQAVVGFGIRRVNVVSC